MTDNLNDDEHTDLDTLIGNRFAKIKVGRGMRELITIFIFMLGMALAFAIFGVVQYWVCSSRYPDITPSQCFRAEYPRGKK